jgi:hypothetical protein
MWFLDNDYYKNSNVGITIFYTKYAGFLSAYFSMVEYGKS